MSLFAVTAPVAWVQPALAQTDVSRAEILTAARMRAGPGENTPIVGLMYHGEVVQVLLQNGAWSKILRSKTGVQEREGWVRSDLMHVASETRDVVKAIEPNAPVLAAAGVVPRDSAEVLQAARMRAGPTEQEHILARLYQGEVVQVVHQENGWTKIHRMKKAVLDYEGWVRSDLLHLAQAVQTAVSAEPAKGEPERFLVQVLVPSIAAYEKPDATLPVIALVEQGTELAADQKQGDWYRVKRAGGGDAWILNAATGTGASLGIRPFPKDRRIAYEVGQQDPRRAESLSKEQRAQEAADKEHIDETAVARSRPQGAPLEPRLPIIDPSQVEPPSPLVRREEIPIRDRWRLVKALKLLPYNPLDPYNPNEIKGDLPVLQDLLGEEWFFSLTAISDTLYESRRLPTPVGAQSTLNAGSNGQLGRGKQSTFAETAILSLALIKGNTTFKPPDYEFRFVPVFNVNYTKTEEVRAININPARGNTRNDNFVGVQELFVDKHLRNVSERYDFDSLRIGIQPFTADFRGFLFLDQPFGVRLFGTRDNNLFQYNLAWFRRLEKDTNSGLNDIGKRLRNDDIFLFNVYSQDNPTLGFTTQATILHNRNREGNRPDFFNNNDFLERPAIFGDGRPHNYDVTYLGLNGDGHFGRWNVSASGYYAFGQDRNGRFSGVKEDISAYFGALELSRDFDWIRVRASGLWASGDKDPYDNKATGFDSVLENPQFAGADTSYFIRQAVPLIGGGGTALSTRNGLLASLKTSREHGQSNFTNPGIHLLGIGADFDVTPRFRVLTNANYLEFDNLSSLAALRNQKLTSTKIGYDLSVGVQYRPYFSQNIVLNASFATLLPAKGLKELYGNAVDSRQYSAILNLILTF